MVFFFCLNYQESNLRVSCPVQFIVVFVVKVLKVKEVNDVREYEDEDGSKAAAGLLRQPRAENNDDDAGHHNSAEG